MISIKQGRNTRSGTCLRTSGSDSATMSDGYLLSVPDEDVERLFCNLGAEGDKLLDNSRQKWNEIKALLYELLTSKSQYVSGVKICTLEDKISDLAIQQADRFCPRAAIPNA